MIEDNVETSKRAKSCEIVLLLYTRQRKLLISALLAVDKNERFIVNFDSSKNSFELENLKEKYPLEFAIEVSVIKFSTVIERDIAVV